VEITVEKYNGVHVAIIQSDKGRASPANLVYLTGTVLSVDAGAGLLELAPAGGRRGSVRVQPEGAARRVLTDLRQGDYISLLGELDGPHIRTGALWRTHSR
jgi:hypothetical protein